MKLILTALALSAGVYLGVNLEADTQALHIARMQHVSYKQIIKRSPLTLIQSLLGGK